jgi:glycosyltransferase involved in cell wall biosynthesis
MKMKIGIISEAPILTTGFAGVSNQIGLALSKAVYDVVYFGIGVIGEVFNRNKKPYRVWTVGKDNLIPTLSEFFSYEELDILIISLDIISLNQWVNFSRAVGWKGPIIGYFVVDGLPIVTEYLEVLNTLQGKITATQTVFNYLKNLGINDVQVAPHGIDRTIFAPLDKKKLRQHANLEDKFIVGLFGRNNERKQHPRLLMALAELKKRGEANNISLYLHCQPSDELELRGWDLAWLTRELDIENQVHFAQKGFKQLHGIPLTMESSSLTFQPDEYLFPEYYNYIERLNCCDLIINVSYCGGFELGILEAQSCGIPVAITNDSGIMIEVAGPGAYLLEPSDIGIWTTGAKQFFISPNTIAAAITEIKNNEPLRTNIIKEGIKNSMKYPWTKLHEVIIKTVQSI